MQTDQTIAYVDSIDYKDWQQKLTDATSIMKEQQSKAAAYRRLRYAEVDVDQEKRVNALAPDELYIPQHIIDMNIRRESSSYIQYITQPNRSTVMTHRDSAMIDSSMIEKDLTNRLRYDGWQQPMYANIDAMQQNGFSLMEVVFDIGKSGEVAHEYVPMGDFAVVGDTKVIQDCEMIARAYNFPKTKLLAMCSDETWGFDRKQVDKVIATNTTETNTDAVMDRKDKSLFRIHKVMFRVKGVVYVAWTQSDKADNWLRAPRKLYIGRKQFDAVTGQTVDSDETNYPYVLFPYLISENDTISELKGRVQLDQDTQEAVSSLLSSYCTAHRRGSGLYFSKDDDDPNGDTLQDKNVYFRTGALISKKVKQFQLTVPDADTLTAIQALVTANMQETSQVNFAAQNRKDSRKTATEISAASQAAQALSTVQVVLFSSACRQLYTIMFEVIASRVMADIIKVDPQLKALYAQPWHLRPAGDSDVIERQQRVQQMMSAWPVMQATPAATAFLSDLLAAMFPESAQKYITIFQQAQAQQQQQQQSAQAQLMQQAQQLAGQVVELSKHPEMFSDVGKSSALPLVKQAAMQIEQLQASQQQQPKQ